VKAKRICEHCEAKRPKRGNVHRWRERMKSRKGSRYVSFERPCVARALSPAEKVLEVDSLVIREVKGNVQVLVQVDGEFHLASQFYIGNDGPHVYEHIWPNGVLEMPVVREKHI